MRMILALGIVAATIVLVVRRYDIRLALLGGGLALASLAGRPLAVLDAFAKSMIAGMVAPICAAMGFAAVLRVTGCDRHLVNLLTRPLRGRAWAVAPGGIAVAYVVNLAVPSQSGVAAMLGPILVPLLMAAGYRPEVAGAALVLGASFGGDLLNPAAQDVQALAGVTGMLPHALSRRVIPSSVAGLVAAIVVFGFTTRRTRGGSAFSPERPQGAAIPDDNPGERIDLPKAIIPLVPVGMLLLAHAGWTPLGWLLVVDGVANRPDLAAAIPVVRALLIGFGLAALIGWREIRQVAAGLFEGMGAAYRDVISLTIVAQCFGAGVAAVGLGDALLDHVGHSPRGLAFLSIAIPWSLAALSGSGSGPVLAYAQTCLTPLGDTPGLPTFGALACLSAAAGRTMSPVSAVVLCATGLVGTTPASLIRPLLPALVAGMAVALLMAYWIV